MSKQRCDSFTQLIDFWQVIVQKLKRCSFLPSFLPFFLLTENNLFLLPCFLWNEVDFHASILPWKHNVFMAFLCIVSNASASCWSWLCATIENSNLQKRKYLQIGENVLFHNSLLYREVFLHVLRLMLLSNVLINV